MEPIEALLGLMKAIDEHRWDDLERFLSPDFSCRLVHTGEVFDREEWIRFNADYPGFDRLIVEESTGGSGSAACRSTVTSRGEQGLQYFACASFAQVSAGQISRLVEVWTDLGQAAPDGTRLGG